MALKKIAKKKVVTMFNKNDYNNMATEYLEICSQIKVLEARKKSLADQIKSGAESLGVKDDKGSFFLDSGDCVLGKVASKSMKINQEKATEYLKAKGLDNCVKTITVEEVDEEELSNSVLNGKLTLEEVESFTDVKVSYKVSVKEKFEAVEVEQSNLSVAKKK